MKNTKLIALLRTFEKKDFRRFREYLASPFFNKRTDLISFYALLENLSPDFPDNKIERRDIWSQYSPDTPFDEKEFAYLMNFLLKQGENYIYINAVGSDDIARGTLMLNHYLDHGLNKHYRAVYQKTYKDLQAQPYRDAEWQLKAWRLAYTEVHHFYSSQTRKPTDSLLLAAQHLDAFYLDTRLEMSSEALNLNQILKEAIDTSFIDGSLGYMDQLEIQEPAIEIRKLVLMILRDPEDTESFRKLRHALPDITRYFPPEKVKGIFAYAQNFCIRRIKSGDGTFQEELFGIYQEAIEAGAMYEGEFLNPWNFKNVCTVALNLGEFHWTESFIKTHEHRIPPESRTSAVSYNLANLHFRRGDHDKALVALMRVEFSDIFYALDTRRMQLKIYFEREDYIALSSLISSFRIYLRRNRIISESNRVAYKNFVDWLARIFRSVQRQEIEDLEQYAEEIRKTDPIVEGEWLVEKCMAFGLY